MRDWQKLGQVISISILPDDNNLACGRLQYTT